MKTILILAFASLLGGTGSVRPTVAGPIPCDGPDADPWVTALRDRVMSSDGLARLTVEIFGEPTGCDGEVTSEFDGAAFGFVTLTFVNGASLRVETLPPESSVMTLTSPDGFLDEASVRARLQRYVAGIGLSIDWSSPEVGSAGNEILHTFRDPDPGLNASATLILRDERLVGIRVAMAL